MVIEKVKSVGISVNSESIIINVLSQYVRDFEKISSERLKRNQHLFPLECSIASYQIKPVVSRNGCEVVFSHLDDNYSSETQEYVSNLLSILGVLIEDDGMNNSHPSSCPTRIQFNERNEMVVPNQEVGTVNMWNTLVTSLEEMIKYAGDGREYDVHFHPMITYPGYLSLDSLQRLKSIFRNAFEQVNTQWMEKETTQHLSKIDMDNISFLSEEEAVVIGYRHSYYNLDSPIKNESYVVYNISNQCTSCVCVTYDENGVLHVDNQTYKSTFEYSGAILKEKAYEGGSLTNLFNQENDICKQLSSLIQRKLSKRSDSHTSLPTARTRSLKDKTSLRTIVTPLVGFLKEYIDENNINNSAVLVYVYGKIFKVTLNQKPVSDKFEEKNDSPISTLALLARKTCSLLF